jgi:hypothetical protein
MSDLKSWNVITIQGELDADTFNELPTFGLHDGDPWDITAERDEYAMSGWDGATPFRIGDWAKHFTNIRPGTTVIWYEEFRMDDVGESSTVYRDGEKVVAESTTSRMVPDNLDELLAAGRKALATTDPGAKHDALKALVEGLS